MYEDCFLTPFSKTRFSYSCIIDSAPITGLVETRSGLAWSSPANAIECSFDYVVTEDGSELTRTADIGYNTFPICRNLTITVTPVVPSTSQVLTSSSASITAIFNSSTGKFIYTVCTYVYHSM